MERGKDLDARKSKNLNGGELAEVLLENGEEFIEAAFQAFLNRRPDATGGRIYLRALRNGTSKLQVLHEISKSAECQLVGGELPGLAEACARDGIGEIGDKPNISIPVEASEVSCVDQLLVLDDHGKLIEIAYWVLLKRAPDRDGILNYLGRLKDGMSKTQFLHSLFTSAECREIGVELPGLRDAFAREGLDVVDEKPVTSSKLSVAPATTLTELLSHQGAQFVECAYITLFKRAPDSEGFQHRLAQLLGGTSKIQILSEMSASKEEIMIGATLPGLAAALNRYHLSITPILGRFVKLFVDVEGDSVAERRGRASEQRLVTLEAEIGERFEKLEVSSNGISAMEQKTVAYRRDIDARIASLERSIAALRQLIEQYDGNGLVTEPPSSKVGVLKSAGRLALELRSEEIARDLKQVR